MAMFKKVNNPPVEFIPWDECPAKLVKGINGEDVTGISVFHHCVLSGEVAKVLVDMLATDVRSRLPKNIHVLVAYHDLGKVSPGFINKMAPDFIQGRIKSIPFEEMETLHAIISEKSLYKLGEKWCLVAGAHHGARTECLGSAEARNFGGKEWELERQKLKKAIDDHFGASFDFSINCDPISFLFSLGVTTVSDWIASGDNFDQSSTGHLVNYSRVEDVVKKIFHSKPEVKKMFSFEELFTYTPNKLQSCINAWVAKKGVVVVIEDVMGSGKTEAAEYLAYLLWAHGQNDGLYFALPTKMTSNMIYKRIEDFIGKIFGDLGVQLVHGDSWMSRSIVGDNSSKNENASWFNPSKRALLGDFGVGTVDNALLAVVNVKHKYLRTMGLSGKVIIIDEVHSYDAYTSKLIKTFIHHALEIGCSVIVLSATLTSKLRSDLLNVDSKKSSLKEVNEYPLISYKFKDEDEVRYIVPGNSGSKKVKVTKGWIDYSAIVDKANNGQKVLIIRNTVKKAQDTYRALKGQMRDGDSILLIHARQLPLIRRDLEEKCMSVFGKAGRKKNSEQGYIIVATQVAEQSIDIDADYLVTDIAPIDIIFQRCGRLWRHEVKDRKCEYPEMLIINPEIDTNGNKIFDKMYAGYVCERTLEVTSKIDYFNLPDDIRKYVEFVYVDREEKSPYMQQLKTNLEKKRDKEALLAEANTKSFTLPKEDKEETGFSRHSEMKSYSMLIVKKMEDNGDELKFSMVDGTEISISVSSGRKNYEEVKKNRVSLCQNVVRMPYYGEFNKRRVETNDQVPKCFIGHLPENVEGILFLSCDGKLYYDQSRSNNSLFSFTKDLGVFVQDIGPLNSAQASMFNSGFSD